MTPPPNTPSALPPPCRDESATVQALLAGLRANGGLDWSAVIDRARPWVQAVRDKPAPFWAMESLLREYPISSAEGLALMRLAEALLRVPDAETAIALTADQLGRADFSSATADGSPHKLLASLSTSAIGLAKRLLPGQGDRAPGLLDRLGAQTVVAATVRAIQLLGKQFVLGRSIGEALGEARSQRADLPQLRFSFDMLGEGARTAHDAERYRQSYADAIRAIAAATRGDGPAARDGISIKLSALHPRYEASQADRVMAELLPQVQGLMDLAAAADINLTIDAEESDRLELSLQVFDALAAHVQTACPQWTGFGLAIQAYQTRALAMIDAVAGIARSRGLRFMVRLVKGAYWDGEIKRAQELGLAGYPVFTHKHHTDIAYLACAQALLGHQELILPQFATHNAGTVAAIVQMAMATAAAMAPAPVAANAGAANGATVATAMAREAAHAQADQADQAGRRAATPRFELQRLHGMGEAVYREVLASLPDVALRIYAPVGEHRDLLAYLVRRLLENGANSSFVHQLADAALPPEALLRSPLVPAQHPGQPAPSSLYGASRRNSAGLDLTVPEQRAPLLAALAALPASAVPAVPLAQVGEIAPTMARLQAAQPGWNATPVNQRAAVLRRAAGLLETQTPALVALLAREAGKTLGDGVSEVREAVDFCRYYAAQAEERLAPVTLPGPTGESNTLQLHGRGVFVCISPWNFPLAIFAGQVVAALVTGNTVAAKPAEQTPAVAAAFVALLHQAGLPADALALLNGPGETIGAALVAHPAVAGVCFTGSTAVAKAIQRTLAAGDGPIVPLIAETGGQNCMVVDSSALPEQVVDAVVQSAFRSAGQRCSALRVLCLHERIAEPVITMLQGAMAELRCGPADDWASDVGPVIDAEAHAHLHAQVQRLEREARLLARSPLPVALAPSHIAPVAFEVPRLDDLRHEIFGPVLHVLRWGGDVDALVDRINALGFGLTLGVQTRIDSRALRIAERARVGNVYINRNMIGAVVGVQPFGGDGLSGTGPKAGGPHYLPRFCAEQTVTVNTAAAGGNAALLANLGMPDG